MNQAIAIEPSALRPYQARGLARVSQHFDQGAKRVVFCVATGGGKTFCAVTHVQAALGHGKRALILAHRSELLEQFSHTLGGLGIDHGFIKAGDDRLRPDCAVQVASIQTLVQRLRAGLRAPADLIVVDECHRALASTYKEVLDSYPTSQVLGLTATPWRLDNQGLGEVFEEIVVAANTKDLVSDGYLVEPTVYVPARRLDLSNIKMSCGDYREGDLDLLLNNSAVCGNIVAHWLKHAAGLPTIAFAVSLAHSQRIARQFAEAG